MHKTYHYRSPAKACNRVSALKAAVSVRKILGPKARGLNLEHRPLGLLLLKTSFWTY